MNETRCDLCGDQHATLRYTEIDDGRTTKRSICRSCAQSRGLLDVPAQPLEMVQMLLASTQPAPAPEAEPELESEADDRACPDCGQRFGEFRRHGRLGCGRCYTAFEAQLLPVLRKIQPRLRHVGKAPRAFAQKAELRSRLGELRSELERAVRGEDYERAAQLRDQIRDTEREQARAARGETSGEAPE